MKHDKKYFLKERLSLTNKLYDAVEELKQSMETLSESIGRAEEARDKCDYEFVFETDLYYDLDAVLTFVLARSKDEDLNRIKAMANKTKRLDSKAKQLAIEAIDDILSFSFDERKTYHEKI